MGDHEPQLCRRLTLCYATGVEGPAVVLAFALAFLDKKPEAESDEIWIQQAIIGLSRVAHPLQRQQNAG